MSMSTVKTMAMVLNMTTIMIASMIVIMILIMIMIMIMIMSDDAAATADDDDDSGGGGGGGGGPMRSTCISFSPFLMFYNFVGSFIVLLDRFSYREFNTCIIIIILSYMFRNS